MTDIQDLSGAHVEGQRVRLSLLDLTGTPLPDAARWDDDIRVRAALRYRDTQSLNSELSDIKVELFGGGVDTWAWLTEHIRQDSRLNNVIHPFALELWLPQDEQWRHHRLPRIHADDTEPWEFSGHENPNWPDDEDLPGFAERCWSWRWAERLPSDAPELVV